ncbi:MAG TPA: hypothetical protein VGH54_28165 [Mycobacterium sp.]|jgi:hypothetical protein|uniref:hypothetical protein n=1 Tax=Mycobacterium sp. TaxID=1785 RepID=UPI002F42DD95
MVKFAPDASPDLMGRQRRSLGGPVTARAAGNDVVRSDMRGGAAPAAWPGADSGGQSQSSTMNARSDGGLITPTTPDLRGPDQARTAYGGGWSDGLLTIRERAVMLMRGTSRLSARDSYSGTPNPQYDGPPVPQYLQDNRTLSWQIGTDKTTYEDNAGPFATTTTTAVDPEGPGVPQNKSPAGVLSYNAGRTYPLGNQGDPWTTVWGGTPHLTRAYGARGAAGVSGPAPNQFALPGDGSGARIGTMLGQGDPQDGPQKIRGGVPHGRHSASAHGSALTMARLGSIPVQRPPRDDRPNNSKIAGQSMSQTYPNEGSAASGAIPRIAPGLRGRTPGITGRFTGRR